jgi:6-pyruvoyl-tetrahydropterin synthase related domain
MMMFDPFRKQALIWSAMKQEVKVSTASPGKTGRNKGSILNRRGFRAGLFLFGLATLAMAPIFSHGLPPITDAFTHYRWSSGFIDALGEGAVYPRWLANPNFGAGSPAMNYYPPLQFYFVAAFHLVTGDVLKAMAWSCWLALALSGVTSYIFARSMLSQRAALLAAALYVLAPYHLLDLYQRASLSEFWAFAWVPLVLYSTRRVITGEGWRAFPLLAVSYALLLLTHVLTAFATTLVLPIYALLITRDKRRIAKAAAAVGLGLGLSAIFVAPLVLERDYVRLHRIHQEKFTRTFLIENLPAAFSAEPLPAGQEPEFFYQQPDYPLFEAGMAIFIILFALATFLLWRRAGGNAGDNSKRSAFLAVWVVTLLGLLMTTRLSEPIWRFIPGLPFMQYPFRWLLIASVGMSVLSAAALSVAASGKRRKAFGAAIALMLALNLVVAVLAVIRQPRGEQAIPKEVNGLEVPEYRPRTWDVKKGREDAPAGVIVLDGDASAQAVDEHGSRQSYQVAATTDSLVRFPTLYFPGWTGRVDGVKVETSPTEDGYVQVRAGPGEYLLTLSFEDTWPRTIGKLLSLLSLLITGAAFYRTRRKGRRVKPEHHTSGVDD